MRQIRRGKSVTHIMDVSSSFAGRKQDRHDPTMPALEVKSGPPPQTKDVTIPPLGLEGILAIPSGAPAIVLFAHGSGSSRLSPRNTYVATSLQQSGLATLLFDLLRPEEAADRANVFDIELLSDRLCLATEWVRQEQETAGLKIGYFGASTGAAAALQAATRIPVEVGAIVSRGGRPDLAADLSKVQAATLLIVGGYDDVVISLNQDALARLRCDKKLVIVPEAGHLFEEPGKLDEVIPLAREWFSTHLTSAAPEKKAMRPLRVTRRDHRPRQSAPPERARLLGSRLLA